MKPYDTAMSDQDRPTNGSRPRTWFDRIAQIFGGEPRDKEQLVELLKDAESRALMGHDALSMIEGVLSVSELRVRDIMVPRAEMVHVRRDDPFERILEIVIESAHSRFPVTAEDRSEVVGVLIAKDLLSHCGGQQSRPFNLRELLRPPTFVPESKRLNVLLKEFRSTRNHMAIVVDEYGGAAGVVTIEDVLEQIVGEIEDEHDIEEESWIHQRGEHDFVVKARCPIEDFDEYFGSALDNDEFDTIGGFVVNAFGHVPKRSEHVHIEGFRITVMSADSRRVLLLQVEPSRKLPSGEPTVD